MANFDINTDAHIKLTAKLGALHKSALPVAVRGTLNNAAFETKKFIPKTAARKFTTRNKSFFRAFSSVNKASGFSINSMASEVGINQGRGSKVADGLEKQETGGTINGRKLVPHDQGRVSGSHNKKLRKKNRFGNISVVDARKRNGKKGNYLLIKKGSKGTVFEIKGTGKKQKLKPVYTYKNTKKTRVNKSPFMAPASWIAAKKMPQFYVKNAQRQIDRLMR